MKGMVNNVQFNWIHRMFLCAYLDNVKNIRKFKSFNYALLSIKCLLNFLNLFVYKFAIFWLLVSPHNCSLLSLIKFLTKLVCPSSRHSVFIKMHIVSCSQISQQVCGVGLCRSTYMRQFIILGASHCNSDDF